MDEGWEVTLKNGGQTSTIKGKKIVELMDILTDKGLLLLQLKHEKAPRPKNE